MEKKTTRIFNEVDFSDHVFDDWIQVIHYVRDIFLDHQWATERYFEKIILDMIATKSYMVIAPNIVLLHSAPDQEALQDAFHFLKLDHPVNFNHPQNDPVQIVITFSATQKTSHIDAIKNIALLLMSESFISDIKQCQSRTDLIKAIRHHEEDTRASLEE